MELLNIITEWFMWWLNPHFTITEPTQEAWIGAAVAIAGLAAQGFGMLKKNQADKELQAKQEGINSRMNDLTNWYQGEASKDFLDTDSAQSTLGNIREQYDKALDTGNNNAAKGGLTAEAKVAQQGTLQEKYNDALRNLSGYGTQYKQSLNRDYANSLQQTYNNNSSTFKPASDSWQNFMNNGAQVTNAGVQSQDWTFGNGNGGGNDSPGIFG